jgi:cytochrome P450
VTTVAPLALAHWLLARWGMHAETQPVGLSPAGSGRLAPGPTYRNPLAFVLEARSDPLAYTVDIVRRYGALVRVRVWGMPLVFALAHPEHVRHVLQENSRNYTKGEMVGRMRVLLGDGLFTSEGEVWRRQRRLAQPAFHRQRIQGFADLMVERTSRTLDAIEERSRAGAPVDVMAEMSRLALTIVGRALFDVDLGDQASGVGRALPVALEALTRRIFNPLALPMAVPTSANRRLRWATRELDRVVFDIIRRRQESPVGHADLLAMLMEMRDADTGEGMNSVQLRDEVMTFVLAGHETTAVTLAWAVHLLARNPEIERRLRAEIEHAIGDRPPQLADLGNLPMARRVIEETLRLFPPIGAIQRQAIGGDEIDGCAIPAGARIVVCAYAMHRDPALWPDPERFDPDRFLPDRSEGRHRFAYIPFGGGPRLCIGNEFAMMETQIVLAMLLQRFRFEPVPEAPPRPELRITLRPSSGVWMRVRSAAA